MSNLLSTGTGNYHVHLGFWTNWSYGRYTGATLTLSKTNAGLLIAFIAIFVGSTGKSFWRLACFMLHRRFSSATEQDAVYHQRQAILRNVSTGTDAARMLLNSMWMWRGRAHRPYWRLLPIILLALLISASFAVAGVFSSSITRDGANEVLIQGDNCGPLDSDDYDQPLGYVKLFVPFQVSRATAYSQYALRCYTNTSTSEDCNLYIKNQLPTIVDRNASCPFSPEMCKSQTGNIVVDSGYLDSHSDLGVNSAPEDRFQIRLLHQCAPVVTKGFTNVSNTSSGPIQRYYYGNLNWDLANFTYQMPTNYSISNADGYAYPGSARVDYNIGLVKAYSGDPKMMAGNNMFIPIPQLNRTDADVMLFFLSSQGITYMEKTDDAWYSAHRPGPNRTNTVSGIASPSYFADDLVSVLGCTMQYQLCNPNIPSDSPSPRCNPLRGYADFTFDRYALWDSSPSQRRFVKWIDHLLGLGLFTASGIVDAIGAGALRARYNLEDAQQGPLADDQWQQEVETWVAASLASIQGSLVESANGPPPAMMPFKVAPNSTDDWRACLNQKIISTRYASFSVLGIALILSIGGIIMLLDVALEPLLSFIDRRWRGGKRSDSRHVFTRLEWRANSTLQLQRMAHEHAGVGTWSNADGANPITLSKETLAVLDVSDAGHPLLRAPTRKDSCITRTDSEKAQVTVQVDEKK